ncbi:hypothetical protein [Pseudoalteromonas aurantia]|uniref:hypothetical protein n=1 Tax=Pseudoalteromonas aurantia TaxID=43654 RepID=UPI001485F245|nr:hypothetical protein [Pseudoalteromonas aurantia]
MIKVIKALLKSRNSSQSTSQNKTFSDKVLDINTLRTVSGARGGGGLHCTENCRP